MLRLRPPLSDLPALGPGPTFFQRHLSTVNDERRAFDGTHTPHTPFHPSFLADMPFSRHVAPAISPLRRLCVSRCVAGRRQLSISSQSRLPALQSYYASSSSPIPRCVISSISPSKQRLYSSSSSSPTPTSDNNDYPKRIAIIGGGISGLASAHFISKAYPKSQITVFEKEGRVGGWVMSERIEVNEEGRESKGGKDSVLFEYGARTLRPGVLALPTMQLVSHPSNAIPGYQA